MGARRCQFAFTVSPVFPSLCETAAASLGSHFTASPKIYKAFTVLQFLRDFAPAFQYPFMCWQLYYIPFFRSCLHHLSEALAANTLLEPVNLNLTNKFSFAVMQSGTEVPERIGIVSPLHQAQTTPIAGRPRGRRKKLCQIRCSPSTSGHRSSAVLIVLYLNITRCTV